jgi:hypothetical protein
MAIISKRGIILAIVLFESLYNQIRGSTHMRIITNHSADLSILKPIPPKWEGLRRKVASEVGRHAIIAGGAIR